MEDPFEIYVRIFLATLPMISVAGYLLCLSKNDETIIDQTPSAIRSQESDSEQTLIELWSDRKLDPIDEYAYLWET